MGKRHGSRIWTMIVSLVLAGCAPHINTQVSGELQGYRSDVTTVQIVSAVIGGKNVFVPSTIVVTDDRPQTLSVYNTTDKPHGFAIPGLGIEVVLPAQEETQIPLPPLTGGEIHRINCHLHPPHRSATLVVVRGR